MQLRQGNKRPLYYEDLAPGGILAEHVDVFPLFQSYAKNEVFLDFINYVDGTEESLPMDDGFCENLCSYSHVRMNECSGGMQPPSMDINSE